MKSAVIIFPGSNCDRDIAVTIEKITGQKPLFIWHKESVIPNNIDFIALPGGFTYGDYLRSGAMASSSPIIYDLKKKSEKGVSILGICNGFQILTECRLLTGALLRNKGLNFICRDINLRVEQNKTKFTSKFSCGEVIRIPIAHHDGNYYTDQENLRFLNGDGLVAFRYCNQDGKITTQSNPNGSKENIAGVLNPKKNILGMMPHPERLSDRMLGGEDGSQLFKSILDNLS